MANIKSKKAKPPITENVIQNEGESTVAEQSPSESESTKKKQVFSMNTTLTNGKIYKAGEQIPENLSESEIKNLMINKMIR